MPAIYRHVLMDHFVRGYPVKRIARQNRIPAGTVLSPIFKAKRLLRVAWED
jgi:DNA-directed RNA polymerase specialized sigma24 family protein